MGSFKTENRDMAAATNKSCCLSTENKTINTINNMPTITEELMRKRIDNSVWLIIPPNEALERHLLLHQQHEK
jgi:hypothetical protein